MAWDGRFDDSAAAEGGMPDPGAYTAEVVDAERKESRTTGDGMISLKMRLLEVEWHAYDNLMMTGKGAGMGKKKAEAFGITLAKGEAVDESAFIGRRVRVHLVTGSYKSRKRLEVDIDAGTHLGYDVLASDGGEPGGEDTDFASIDFKS